MAMTEAEKLAYGLVAMASNPEMLKPHLDELVKAREDAEAAAMAAAKERSDLDEATRQSSEKLVAERKDWERAKAEHDAAAEEARKRINLQSQQLTELNATKEDVDHKLAAIAEREKAVTAAADRAERQHAQLTAALERVASLRSALRAVDDEVKTMREALG